MTSNLKTNAKTITTTGANTSATAAASLPVTSEPGAQTAAALLDRVERESGQHPALSSADTWMRVAAHACRAELAQRMNRTLHEDRGARRVHYLSMEFLMGRALSNAVAALDLAQPLRQAVQDSGKVLEDIVEREPDAALGNGGLGRLAACFLDSLATLGVPAFGYGLRYRYGMFAQRIHDGRQVETPDDWLRQGNPWELERTEIRYPLGLAGRVIPDGKGRLWLPGASLYADAYDFVVPGHGTPRVAVLRLWQATPTQPIDFNAFSRGDFGTAGAAKQAAEVINWVLYPDDSTPAGRELRLKQEFFLVSASLQDIVEHRNFKREHRNFKRHRQAPARPGTGSWAGLRRLNGLGLESAPVPCANLAGSGLFTKGAVGLRLGVDPDLRSAALTRRAAPPRLRFGGAACGAAWVTAGAAQAAKSCAASRARPLGGG